MSSRQWQETRVLANRNTFALALRISLEPPAPEYLYLFPQQADIANPMFAKAAGGAATAFERFGGVFLPIETWFDVIWCGPEHPSKRARFGGALVRPSINHVMTTARLRTENVPRV